MALKIFALLALVLVVSGRRGRYVVKHNDVDALYGKPAAKTDPYLKGIACIEAKQDKMQAKVDYLLSIVKNGKMLEMVYGLWIAQKNITDTLNTILENQMEQATNFTDYMTTEEMMTTTDTATAFPTEEITIDDMEMMAGDSETYADVYTTTPAYVMP